MKLVSYITSGFIEQTLPMDFMFEIGYNNMFNNSLQYYVFKS